jgi:PAS domain S-box-containing protein
MTDENRTPTILIADDQPGSLVMLISFLESCGYSLMAAQSGEAALEQARRFPPDLMLLDVLMPGGMDGFETCRCLKQNPLTRDIPVLFLTVLDQTIDKVQGFAAGGLDFISKPVEHAEVLARVQTHLNIRRLQQALQKENERCRALTDAMFDGVLIFEYSQAQDRFQIAEANRALSEMFAYTREELLSLSLEKLFVPDVRHYVKKHIIRNESPAELTGLRKDRTRFPLEIRCKPVVWQERSMHVAVIRDLSARKTLEQENLLLRASLKDRYRFGRIIGKSPVMQDLYELIARAAASDATVLLLGESGSGKEIAARTVHEQSKRRNNAFVAVNCGAISRDLFEREFFGHRKGAFTGADCDKPGFFDAAQGGTLFLDEIGELTLSMQAALLRVIEHHEYIPVGSTRVKHSDVRLIAATHRNLPELIRNGKFRQDFYFRLDLLTIKIPPLREHKEDIPLLIDHFLEHYGKDKETVCVPRLYLTDDIRQMLYHAEWRGNVRELYHTLERWLITGRLELRPRAAKTVLSKHEIPDSEPRSLISLPPVRGDMPLEQTMEVLEKELIVQALRQNLWRKKEAAARLGINRKTLYEKMRKYGLQGDGV